MTPEARTSLLRLAGLLSARNLLDAQIAGVIQRPALAGHIGEFIASLVFGIQLATSAAQAGHDGRFSDGPLAGNAMNVKCYATREGLLDINDRNLPDYYLVLAGPKSDAMTSTAGARPFMVEEVFLFNAESLVAAQRARGVAVGVASSVPTRAWEAVRIFPAGAQTLATVAGADRPSRIVSRPDSYLSTSPVPRGGPAALSRGCRTLSGSPARPRGR